MRRLRRSTRSVDRTPTVREREVMRLAAKGLTNRAIAHELNVTEGTIKLHLHNIYRKLAINSRFALAALVNRKAS
jgi:DNA-binding NarL/FixJ family response regulator